ncbi:MAG TPA: hypothetical protein VK843_06125 [Planctomycetota bacterium]|nr:hypothetical protein [Planctomycetota bacterium]
MSFQPAFCPRAECLSRTGSPPFTYRRRGQYRRHCDQRIIQRFLCLACRLSFSEQNFRLDYRLKRPDLLAPFFWERVSKVTHRQSARIHACSRSTEERHFRRLSRHCEAFHTLRLAEIAARGGLGEVFLLDELETYEEHRTKKPVTVPILIERKSGFVIDTRVGTLPARGRPGAAKQHFPEGKATAESEVERKSESREVVQAAFERLRETSPKDRPIRVLTDEKLSYATLLKELFGERCLHERTPSTRRRDVCNPLWPINHTLARVRDNVSRLVRETWAAAKLRRWLAGQLAIWVCYRNYVRGRTNREHTTPAMALGFQAQPWSVPGLLEWRVFPAA